MTALERLKIRIPEETDENVLTEMLESARDIILSLRFPFGDWPDEVPNRYSSLQIQIAEDMYNRIGAAGQLSHSENSISRSWGSEWVSEQLLAQIVPVVGGLK
jgi:hypothetical protein